MCFIASRIALGFGRQDHLTVSTLVAILGLVLGVAVLLVVLSVMNGFERELRERVLALVPHMTLYTSSSTVDDTLIEALDAHPEVAAYGRFIEGVALVSVPGRVVASQLTGLTQDGIRELTILAELLDPGSKLPRESYDLLVGSQLAHTLGVAPGDLVTVTLPDAIATPLGLFPRLRNFRISGVFTSGTQLDGTGMFAHLKDARRLFARRPAYLGWRVRLHDLFAADWVSWELQAQAPRLIQRGNWMHTHGGLYDAVVTQKSLMRLLLFMVVAVAAFNVVSSLRMLASRKEGDIAILMSLGANRGLIMGIFAWLAGLICLTGVLLGLLTGTGVALVLDDLYAWFESSTGLELMGQYFVRHLPVQIQIGDLFVIVAVSALLCVVAAILPARRASAVMPAEILRNE